MTIRIKTHPVTYPCRTSQNWHFPLWKRSFRMGWWKVASVAHRSRPGKPHCFQQISTALVTVRSARLVASNLQLCFLWGRPRPEKRNEMVTLKVNGTARCFGSSMLVSDFCCHTSLQRGGWWLTDSIHPSTSFLLIDSGCFQQVPIRDRQMVSHDGYSWA